MLRMGIFQILYVMLVGACFVSVAAASDSAACIVMPNSAIVGDEAIITIVNDAGLFLPAQDLLFIDETGEVASRIPVTVVSSTTVYTSIQELDVDPGVYTLAFDVGTEELLFLDAQFTVLTEVIIEANVSESNNKNIDSKKPLIEVVILETIKPIISETEVIPESTVKPDQNITTEEIPQPTIEIITEATSEPTPETTQETVLTTEEIPQPTIEIITEATPEPTIEPTPETTQETVLTTEAIPQPTIEIITEATPEPTIEPTPETTQETVLTTEEIPQPTIEIITEATPEPTIEPTPETTQEPAPVSYTITAHAKYGGTISPSGEIIVDPNTTLEFVIIPDMGYSVADLIIDGKTIEPASLYTFEEITSDHTIEVQFGVEVPPAPEGKVSVITDADQHTQISPSGALFVDTGTSLTFTIKAVPGSEYTALVVNGEETTPEKVIRITADTDYIIQSRGQYESVEAKDVPEPIETVQTIEQKDIAYTIISRADAGGTIEPLGEVSVTAGSNQTFAIIPDPGYQVKAVLIDGVGIGGATEYMFEDVQESHSIRALFGR